MNDDDVYRAAEQVRESQPFNAQDVADQLLESDVGGVLQSLHRLVAAGRLVLAGKAEPYSASKDVDDRSEYESFKFPD